MAGSAWNNSEGLTFTDSLGNRLKHDLIYRHFNQVGILSLRFHNLRHSYAVLSIQAGDDIKTLQENLGHYSAAFALGVYGHVPEQMKRDSSERMDRYIHNIASNQ